jgi:hypothetical protein
VRDLGAGEKQISRFARNDNFIEIEIFDNPASGKGPALCVDGEGWGGRSLVGNRSRSESGNSVEIL